MKRLICLVFFTFFFSLSSAHAGYELRVEEEIPVFGRPKKGRVIKTLEPGDVVPIADRRYKGGRYRRVVIEYKGRKAGAYIRSADIQLSQIVDPSQTAVFDEKEPRKPSYKSSAFGISAMMSFAQQGESNLTAENGVDFELDALSGTTLNFAVYHDYPMGGPWHWRTYIGYRQTILSGKGCLVGSSDCGSKSDFERDISFVTGGAIVKNYLGKSWYWGFGGEIQKALSSKLTTTTSVDKQEAGDVPLRFMGFLNIGWDIRLSRSWAITPDLRAGAVFSTSPVIITAEGVLSLSYFTD